MLACFVVVTDVGCLVVRLHLLVVYSSKFVIPFLLYFCACNSKVSTNLLTWGIGKQENKSNM